MKLLEEEIGTASQQLEEVRHYYAAAYIKLINRPCPTKTVQALETHPTDQMHMWMEQVHTTVPDKS